MERRQLLIAALPATIATALRLPAQPVSGTPRRSPIGVAWTSFMGARRVNDPFELSAIALKLGAVGIQGPISDLGPAAVARLREHLESNQLYFESAASPPFQESDATAFEAQLRAAQAAGARCVRLACLSGRRYETFHSLDEWRAFVARSRDAIRRMVTLAERVRMPVAMENHKDWTGEEMAALLKEHSSEYLGVRLDFGNNLSLLDDPYDVVERLAPYAISTHMKDARVSLGPKGLLLGDVALGDGVLDIARILDMLRKGGRKPKLSLEMITREPLEVPVFAASYWTTFPERPGLRLARTVELGAARPVTSLALASLSADARAALEENNIRRCLDWARQNVAWDN